MILIVGSVQISFTRHFGFNKGRFLAPLTLGGRIGLMGFVKFTWIEIRWGLE